MIERKVDVWHVSGNKVKLTGRWQIRVIDGDTILSVEGCTSYLKQEYIGKWFGKKLVFSETDNPPRFYNENDLEVYITDIYPIQECNNA